MKKSRYDSVIEKKPFTNSKFIKKQKDNTKQRQNLR